VYISNSSTAERLAEWLRWYNITAEVVKGLDDPINFLKKQAAVGRAAVYVATDGNVTIYSTSVYGPMVAGLVERALYLQRIRRAPQHYDEHIVCRRRRYAQRDV
jgi:hypothetical protein